MSEQTYMYEQETAVAALHQVEGLSLIHISEPTRPY